MNPLLSLKNEIIKSKLDAVLISSIPNIIYLTNFVGFSKDEREAYLLVTKNKNYLLTDGRYITAVKSKVTGFEFVEISSKNSMIKSLKNLKTKHSIKKLGIEEDDLTVSEYKKITKHYNDTYHYSGIKLLRNTKTRVEIKKIGKACELGDRTFEYIFKKIRLGVTEKELAFEIEFFIRKRNADISFPPIVAYGANSAIPHHAPTNNKLTNNQIILLDFGVKVNNYCSDMTRTVFFGSADAEYKKMYQTVLEAQKRSIDFLKSSIINHESIAAKDIDKVARDYITSKGYPTIPHSLGHGIGLEVHESPRLSPKSKDMLKPGMVFTIEPGIYIPGFGGVRIEDVVVLNKKNYTLLTKSGKELIEIT